MSKTVLSDVIELTYLNEADATFSMENGFLALDYMGEHYPRVYLHRAFPFEMQDEYISVLDDDKKEIGMIRSVRDDFTSQAALIYDELSKKYYTPVIKSISEMKDNYGFMQVKCDSDRGALSFGVRDIYRSIIKCGGGRVFIVDVDGNRYEIPSLDDLDRSSYKKLELYL
ncbi:MAG: DUF1854 domain-containing protein [Clostridia bacterium]|nr:DUF1854 domain-containing protein [Clostridia bacterium]